MNRYKDFFMFQVLLILGMSFCVGCSHNLAVSPTTSSLTPSPTSTAIVPNTVVYTPPQADNLLSANVYNCYKSQSSNVLFSPFSIITALAMVQEGAVGTTATQMQNVLGLNSNASTRQQGFQQLINSINAPGKSYTVDTANNVWIQQGFSVLSSYANTVQTYYSAAVGNVDFVNNAVAALQTINGAVSQETAGYIPALFTSLSPTVRLVLTNAIYFQANWNNPFNTSGTSQQTFNLASGNTETVSMMHGVLAAPIGSFNGLASVVAIPYANNQASMYIFLPPNGATSALESAMTGANLNSWLAANSTNLTSTSSSLVSLSLPKFTFSESYDLTNTLMQLGISLAFIPAQADFSGIDGARDLSISDVIHKAYIAVNETGTTAAAATGITVVTLLTGTAPFNSTPFVADHPFLFAIVDNSTNTVLFMGRVSDPLAN